MPYSLKQLLILKEMFYTDMVYEGDNAERFTSALNLFYGYPADTTPHWKEAFKKVVKKPSKSNEKGVQVSQTEFKAVPVELIIGSALAKGRDIKQKLKSLYFGTEFRRTLIYEAPPYSLLIQDPSKPEEGELVAKFILDERCGGPYANAILNCFKSPAKSSVHQSLRANHCGFFDVIPIPLPINSELRNLWATDERYLIDGKRIFVHFFEWAVEKYIDQVSIVSTKPHRLAVGIPLNNAITLYEHYEAHGPLVFKGNKIEFNAPHSLPFSAKKVGLWIHAFKNCIISRSNTPTGDLMELAFA